MTAQTKTVLTGYFNSGDKPSEANFTDLIDSLNARFFGRLVAANDAPADVKAQADYVCDGTADDVQIQAALDALTGGTVLLSTGTFTLAATATITIGANERLIGSGNATIITRAAAGDNPWIVLGNNTALERLKTTLVYQVTSAAAIRAWNIDTFTMRDLVFTGGSDQLVPAISMRNSFNHHCDNIYMGIQCNGWEIIISSPPDNYEYGNGIHNHCEVHNHLAGATLWHIAGAGTRTYNLMTLEYCAGITHLGYATGSIGWQIDNCQFITLINCDGEGSDTSLDINGAVGGGRATQGIVFINPYFDNAVNIDANSFSTVFMGGRIQGTITDGQATVGRKTRWLGTMDVTGAQIADNADGL